VSGDLSTKLFRASPFVVAVTDCGAISDGDLFVVALFDVAEVVFVGGKVKVFD